MAGILGSAVIVAIALAMLVSAVWTIALIEDDRGSYYQEPEPDPPGQITLMRSVDYWTSESPAFDSASWTG